MKHIEAELAQKLVALAAQDKRRYLPGNRLGADFWSNDYLGIAQDLHLQNPLSGGATGSRLISGDQTSYQATEARIAKYHQAEAALVFNSGYAANLGLLAAIPGRTATILYDSLCHASMRDGIRLSYAKSFSFRHNDLAQLEKRLQRAEGNVFVVTESVFSMDGDQAPLIEMAALCQSYQAALIVDEAHAVGVHGPNGAGLVPALDLVDAVFARVITFGKALGAHGAAVLGSQHLVDYLLNTARPFIFSTGLPPHAWQLIEEAYHCLATEQTARVASLRRNIQLFDELYGVAPDADRHIKVIPCPGNQEVVQLEKSLLEMGILTKAIRHPTVAQGSERLRICLHAFNTAAEIEALATGLSKKQTYAD